jgi:hypothetical protein
MTNRVVLEPLQMYHEIGRQCSVLLVLHSLDVTTATGTLPFILDIKYFTSHMQLH